MSIYLDIFIVLLLSIYLVREKQLNVLNPCLIYLFIHVFFVTFRGIQIFFFSSKIISNKWYSTYITLAEIDKAILIADISLVAFFIGFNLFVRKFKNNGNKLLKKYNEIREGNPKRINYYLITIFIIGLIGIATYRSIADRDILLIESIIFFFKDFLNVINPII